MTEKNLDITGGKRPVYRAQGDRATLLKLLPAIRALGDSEKEALGFLPEAAYREAIERRRLIAMCASLNANLELVGFILYSGVFPNARIQQIVVAKPHRRGGVASALVNELVSQLEARGYLTITAAVASDLPDAQAFYGKRGFVARRSRQGGHARKRTIILRARDLDTVSLFSAFESASFVSPSAIDLGLRKRSASQAPLCAIDLNVIFDLTKSRNRPRSPAAGRVFAAGLAHQIRLAVAPEFIVELERQTRGENIDPILKLARQLPRLPVLDVAETNELVALIHSIVFAATRPSRSGTPQTFSDARHLAQAALARASCYITSDGRMLAAREQLLQQIGIDVVSLNEFVALLPVEPSLSGQSRLMGTDCVMKSAPVGEVRQYLEEQRVTLPNVSEFAPLPDNLRGWSARAVYEAGELVAVGARVAPVNIDAPTRVMVHVRPDHVAFEIFADYLLDCQCQEACSSGPVTIELPCIPGQTAVRRAATLRGFLRIPGTETLVKVALGRPITKASWTEMARLTRRRTGLQLPEAPPDLSTTQTGLLVLGLSGQPIQIRLPALEDVLSPTILVWPNRDGVIVPIARSYADDLLGTSDQLTLFGRPEAAFVSLKTYFSSPRTASLMPPGAPILFYESKRSGGRGAVVAVARIADATVMAKDQVPGDLLRHAVVDDLEPLSASTDVLATSFDNLLRFPEPVPLQTLRALKAEGPANLQTATALTSTHLTAILELGWPRA